MSSRATSYNRRRARPKLIYHAHARAARETGRLSRGGEVTRPDDDVRDHDNLLKVQLVEILHSPETRNIDSFGIVAEEKINDKELVRRKQLYESWLNGHWTITMAKNLKDGISGWIFVDAKQRPS